MPIQVPRDTTVRDVQLDWNASKLKARNGDFVLAQKTMDSEVLKHCSKRVPFDTGSLYESGILHTRIGSGLVVWRTPYAKNLYYNPQYNFQGAPMRGGLWFERMKADVGNQIIDKAKRIAGGD